MDTPTLDHIIENLGSDAISRPAFAALKRLEGEMKRRVHQNGQDVNGQQLKTFSKKKLGSYSLAYGKKRDKAGRQVSVKDLEFHGNLRRAITVGTYENGYALGFLYDKARLIAEGQEGQTRTTIFAPSDEERQLMMDIFIDQLSRVIFP